ncbi:hypothetical protein Pan216_21970 [Planctomycetes bacterium Pan216]|uniref:Uncharacterized protein n=1 Tax=Kolteria novifilia TaxID=2527975 RepID=A0A518B325_9BACT|nr:hypothetical protein Pan216_21970 [Planctomycetes bacterium Pan216]
MRDLDLDGAKLGVELQDVAHLNLATANHESNLGHLDSVTRESHLIQFATPVSSQFKRSGFGNLELLLTDGGW